MLRRSKTWIQASALLLTLLGASAETVPPVGKIDFYGLRSIRPQEIRNHLGVSEGDPTPTNTQPELAQRLLKIPGVVNAKVTSVCCEDGKSTVFVGVQEQAGPQFEFNPVPTGSVTLPREIVDPYDHFMDALTKAVQQGDASEDDSHGHALYASTALQPFTKNFITLANTQADLLKRVLKDSSNPKHRSVAAWTLGYAGDKRSVVGDLMAAVRDPDEGVRNDATRAIGTIAVLDRAQPELKLRIEPGVFIQMLNSLSWSDRNKAMMVLLQLSEVHPPEVLMKMRQESLPALIEMARWQDGHSFMALHLVGRIAGLSSADIESAFREGRREQVIAKALVR